MPFDFSTSEDKEGSKLDFSTADQGAQQPAQQHQQAKVTNAPNAGMGMGHFEQPPAPYGLDPAQIANLNQVSGGSMFPSGETKTDTTKKEGKEKPKFGQIIKNDKNKKTDMGEPIQNQIGASARNIAYGTPVVGGLIKDIGQHLHTEGKAVGEAFSDQGKNFWPGVGARLAGTGIGAVGAVETPMALVYELARHMSPQILSDLVSAINPQAGAMAKVAGAMNPQLQQAGQQGVQQAQQGMPSYPNLFAGGKTATQQLHEANAKAFPKNQAALQAGEDLGGLAIGGDALASLAPAEKMVLSQIVKNPAIARAVEGIAQVAVKHPVISKMLGGTAAGAGEGMGYGAVYGGGSKAMQGQGFLPSGEDLQKGAAAGMLLHPFSKQPKEQTPQPQRQSYGPEMQPHGAYEPPRRPLPATTEGTPQTVDAESVQEVQPQRKQISQITPKALPGPTAGPARIESRVQPGFTPHDWQTSQSAIPLPGKPNQVTEPTAEQRVFGNLIKQAGPSPHEQGMQAPPAEQLPSAKPGNIAQAMQEVNTPQPQPTPQPPPQQAAPPVVQPAPPPPKPVSEIVPPVKEEAPTINSKDEALAALDSKSTSKKAQALKQAAYDYLQRTMGEAGANTEKKEAGPNTILGQKKKLSEVTEPSKPEPAAQDKAVFDAIGRPTPTLSIRDPIKGENEWINRQNMSQEEAGHTMEKDKQPFDWTNPQPRPGYGTDVTDGATKKMYLSPVAGVDKEGNPVTISHTPGSQNYDNIDRVTHIAQAVHFDSGGKRGWDSPKVQEQLANAEERHGRGTTTVQRLNTDTLSDAQIEANRQRLLHHEKTGDLSPAEYEVEKMLERKGKSQNPQTWRGVVNALPGVQLAKMGLGQVDKFAKKIATHIYGNKAEGEAAVDHAKRVIADAAWQHQHQHDTIRDFDPILDHQLVRNEAQAAMQMSGIGYVNDPRFTAEADAALRNMSPGEIMNSPDTANWTPEQRQGTAYAKAHLMDSRQLIQDKLAHEADDINPILEDSLKSYSSRLYSRTPLAPANPQGSISTILKTMLSGLATGKFQDNIKFAQLLGTHTVQQGPGMFGFKALFSGYHLLATDPNVRSMMMDSPLAKEPGQPGFIGKLINKRLPESLKGITVGKFNNAEYGVGQAIHDHGIEAVKEYARQLKDPATRGQVNPEITESLFNGVMDGNGGVQGGVGLDFLGKDLYAKMVAPFMRYSAGVQRLTAKNWDLFVNGTQRQQWDALYHLAAQGTMRAMLGGSLLPSDFQEPLDVGLAKISPQAFWAATVLGDYANVPRWADMDISQHTSSGFRLSPGAITAAWATTTNALKHQKYLQAAGTALEAAGMGNVGRLMQVAQKMTDGYEVIPMYMRSALFANARGQSMVRPYGAAAGLRDMLGMGSARDVAVAQARYRAMTILKLSGLDFTSQYDPSNDRDNRTWQEVIDAHYYGTHPEKENGKTIYVANTPPTETLAQWKSDHPQ